MNCSRKKFVENGDCEETPVDNYVLFDVMEELAQKNNKDYRITQTAMSV